MHASAVIFFFFSQLLHGCMTYYNVVATGKAASNQLFQDVSGSNMRFATSIV